MLFGAVCGWAMGRMGNFVYKYFLSSYFLENYYFYYL